MPHRCVACGCVVRKNSRALFEGCPDCGGLKFVYQPPGRDGNRARQPARAAVGKTAPQKKAVHQKKAAGKPCVEEPLKEPELASFESIRMIDEGTYIINIKNLMDAEPFVLGLDDGRYVIPMKKNLKM